MIDWNWLFSALPQSAAAIVGLMGAFLITKIVSNEAEFRQTARLAQSLLEESQHLRDKLSVRNFDWYNETSVAEELEDLQEELQERGGDLESAEHYYARGTFSPYVPRQEVIESIRRLIADLRRPSEAREPSAHTFGDLTYSLPDLPRIQPIGLFSSLKAERDKIDDLVVDIHHQIRRITRLHRRLTVQPHSSGLISGAILSTLLIFYVAVVYPLGWLPLSGPPSLSVAPSDILAAVVSLRGALLGALALIFTIVMGYFWWTNKRLRYSQALLRRLKESTSVSWYSDHLTVLSSNQIEAEAAVATSEDDG